MVRPTVLGAVVAGLLLVSCGSAKDGSVRVSGPDPATAGAPPMATTATGAGAGAGADVADITVPCGARAIRGPGGDVQILVADPTTAPPGQTTSILPPDPNPNCHQTTTTTVAPVEDAVAVGGEIVVPLTSGHVNGPTARSVPLTGSARVKKLDGAGRRWSTSVTITGAIADLPHTFGIVTVSEGGGMGGVFLHTICQFTTGASGAGSCTGALDLDQYHPQQPRIFDNVSLGWSGPEGGYASAKFPGR